MDDFDPLSPAVMAEPSCPYEFLHEKAPVHLFRDFDPPFYTLSRHDDVEHALRDIATYSSEFGQGPRFSQPAGMLSNPPQHTFFRSLVQKAFTPKAIEARAGRIQALADELLDVRPAVDAWDLHDDFAFPLPVVIISEMLGVPSEDLHLFKRWSDASVAAMGAKDPAPYQAELADLGRYLLREIASRREDPSGDDLITGLVNAREGDRGLEDLEVLGVVTQLLVGGNETTTSLITNVAWRLLQRRELWERVVADEALVEVAIEESLRYDPPVLGLYRTTTRDVELHGTTMPESAKVLLHYAAANRDPRAYVDAGEFSLDHGARRHLAFGLGVHFCLGAPMARLEARIALATLARRCPGLRLLGDGERITPFFLWGRKHLPVSG